jgi:hypothetical protein
MGNILDLSACALPTYGAEKFPKRIIELGLTGLIDTVEFALARGSTMKAGGEECADITEDGGAGGRVITSVASSSSSPSPSLSSSEESKSSIALGCVCKVSKNDVGEEGAGECIATSTELRGISSVSGMGLTSLRRKDEV